MDIKENYIKYLEMLKKPFEEDSFKEFITDLLNLEQADLLPVRRQNPTSEQYKRHIDYVERFAWYEDKDRNKIGAIIIKVIDNKSSANARTLQRNYVAHLLAEYKYDAAMVAFYNENETIWRLSFVKKEGKFTPKGYKEEISPAKRYSYLVGEGEPNHTAEKQLLGLLNNNTKKHTVKEIEDVFSVEKVTKEFFGQYKDKYLDLKKSLDNNPEFNCEATRCGFTSEEFAKKLMGQLIFLYFIQKKGWLGVRLVPIKLEKEEYSEIYNKQDVVHKKIMDEVYNTDKSGNRIMRKNMATDSLSKEQASILSDCFVKTKYENENPWGSGNKNFIRTIFDHCENNTTDNFFDKFLEPLFYGALNKKRDNDYFNVFNCKIPFLNGGLFQAIGGYHWENTEFEIPNSLFSNEKEKGKDNADGILDIFGRYNFTMNEEEPLEKDVAVDPEMLGKIFENLLDITDRKSKGAFYTPREIVHYMCQESLANYLVNEVGVDYEEIKEFIQYGDIIKDIDQRDAKDDVHIIGDTIYNNVLKIDEALKNIKVADPAVGSGAFPLGMLNEIVRARDTLTYYFLLLNKNGKLGEEYILKTRNIYELKWNTIRNCIYAVDIEPSAVDITKLRLWLSIVVDQEINESNPEPHTLPNLDCKIMCGNSLIDEYKGVKLFDEGLLDELKVWTGTNRQIALDMENMQLDFEYNQKNVHLEELVMLKERYYKTTNSEQKKELLDEIKKIRLDLIALNFRGANTWGEFKEIDGKHKKPYFSWKLEFVEVFREKGGFDVVIGNPPYLGIQGITKNTPELTNKYKEKFLGATGYYDLYVLFVENGLRYLKHKSGILNYIMPHNWIVSEFGKGLRNVIAHNYEFYKYISFGAHKVFNASTYTSLIWIFNNHINENCNYYEVNKDLNNGKEIADEIHNINVKGFTKINMLLQDNKKWIFANDKNIEIIDKIKKKGTKAKEIFQGIYKGITTGDNKAFCLKDGEEKENYIYAYSEVVSDFVLVEKSITKKMYTGNSLKRYNSVYKNDYIIYPYKLVDSKTVLIEEKEIEQCYPKAYKYLLSIKNRLENRGTEKMKYPSWYSLWNFRRVENFENEKIITPDVCYGTSMILDNNKYYYNDMCYAMIKKKDITLSYEYLLGILNSKVMWFYLNNTGSVLGGGYFRFKTKYIEDFPIAVDVDKQYICEIEKIVKNIKVKNGLDIYFEEKEINEYIYKIYGFTSEEIEIIEKV
ncbi:MAG: hypothetical protein A2Y24_01995 [Clostridiales bacterium GWE2_32_10]|nr:MAG: hypothetical protein A2Y24_01995 [Clostridiales bacterium GWE2_32_10]